MQQRQPRLGDILDDYCPRERRLTNHAVVAMVGDEVKQTRCTTCDAEHEFKHAKVPRQRKKDSLASLQAQALASGPKRVGSDPLPVAPPATTNGDAPVERPVIASAVGSINSSDLVKPDTNEDSAAVSPTVGDASQNGDSPDGATEGDGPAHRRLIRAQLPRTEGQPPPARPAPDFTIRQPGGGRPGRFRPRHQRGAGGQSFQGNRSGPTGGNQNRGGAARSGGNNRPPMTPRPARRHDGSRKRSR